LTFWRRSHDPLGREVHRSISRSTRPPPKSAGINNVSSDAQKSGCLFRARAKTVVPVRGEPITKIGLGQICNLRESIRSVSMNEPLGLRTYHGAKKFTSPFFIGHPDKIEDLPKNLFSELHISHYYF